MKTKMKTKQHGFTLIELVVVIAVLGILSAVALPRLASIQNDARITKLNAARGAVNAAVGIVHGAALIRYGVQDAGLCPGGGAAAATNSTGAIGSVCTESGVIETAFAYPSSPAINAATPGIISAAGLTRVFSPTLAELNADGYGVAVDLTARTTTISVIGGAGTTGARTAQVNSTCSFTYTAPGLANGAAVISAVTTTGC